MPRKAAPKPWATKDYLTQKYEVEQLSTQAIVRAILDDFGLKVYPNTVRRALKKLDIPLRSKSQAQAMFLEKNDHPMLGRERTEEEKVKISEGIQAAWDNLDDNEVEKRKEEMAERARLKWEWMSEEEKRKNIEKMHQANRLKSGMGSKNENLVAELLKEAGYKIAQRTTDYSPLQQFEIDIAIPKEKIALEWDGAAHFAPIYGDKDLKRTMAKDERKNKALLTNNWTVVRCRDHSTAHSLAFCRRAVEKIVDVIKNGKRGCVHYIDAE